MFDPRALKIYTDGSALKNPGGPGGIAAIIEYPEDFNREAEKIFKKGYYKTTNNRMELRACTEALIYIRRRVKELKINYAIIVTDSLYVHDNNSRAIIWKKSQWRNKNGRPIENSDIWDDFLSSRQKVGIHVEIKWLKGKTIEIVKTVDKFAKEAAKNPTETDYGFQPGRVSRKKTLGKIAATLFPANNQIVIIRIYRIQNRGIGRKKEHKIYFDLFSEKDNSYISHHVAYISHMEDISRQHCYEACFNNNDNYPIIESIKLLENCPV